MSMNHPRANNRFNRALIELLRRVESMQAGERLVIERHANGLRFRTGASHVPLFPERHEITSGEPLPTPTSQPDA
jgi:hypothetical protein